MLGSTDTTLKEGKIGARIVVRDQCGDVVMAGGRRESVDRPPFLIKPWRCFFGLNVPLMRGLERLWLKMIVSLSSLSLRRKRVSVVMPK